MKRLALLLALAVAGCDGGEKLAPVPMEDAGADAAPPVTPVAVKRTVMIRNPFGGPAGNLLADGDFELSTVPQAGAQLGWRAFDGTGAGAVNIDTETGGICRSGLRCAVFTNNMVMFLRGASANQKGMVASMWAKPPAGSNCVVVRPILIQCDTLTVHKLFNHSPKPDTDGWCHYSATLEQTVTPTCLYVDNTLPKAKTALLDAAMLGPDDGTVTPLEEVKWVPDAQTLATIGRVQETIRGTLPLGRHPRAPAQSR